MNELLIPNLVYLPVRCKFCRELKLRADTGRTISNGSKRVYVDQFGEKWEGKKCPDCLKKYAREYMRERMRRIRKKKVHKKPVRANIEASESVGAVNEVKPLVYDNEGSRECLAGPVESVEKSNT